MALPSDERVARLAAGAVHYREHGPATGRPVVFVHGFLVDHTLWGDVPELLGERGFRAIAPTWPLGSQPEAMEPDADLSPRGVARVVREFLQHLGLEDVVLVGNDTGGAICQLVLDEDTSHIGRLVLTNCDAFETFPPVPFNLMFRAGRRPTLFRAVAAPTRLAALRNGPLGYGLLTRRRLSGDETRRWITPYLDDAGVRRDTATFLRAWRPGSLVDVSHRLRSFDRPVLLVWAPADRFFPIELGRRLLATFPDARLVEVPDARTFLALDQPERLADEIAAFAA